MLYLGPCLGPYSILVTAGLGGVYIYSCCSCCGGSYKGYYSTLSTASSAIGTTGSAAVEIVGGISRGSYGDFCGHYCRHYYGGCCGGSCGNCCGGDIDLVSS